MLEIGSHTIVIRGENIYIPTISKYPKFTFEFMREWDKLRSTPERISNREEVNKKLNK